jgi:hypothetical protein
MTYVGVVAEVGQLIGLEGGSEAVEAAGVGVVGIRLDGADGRGHSGRDGVLLHADNVLALDVGAATGDNDGSRVVTLDLGVRGREGEGEEGEKSGGTHDDGLCMKALAGYGTMQLERMNVVTLSRDWRSWNLERRELDCGGDRREGRMLENKEARRELDDGRARYLFFSLFQDHPTEPSSISI